MWYVGLHASSETHLSRRSVFHVLIRAVARLTMTIFENQVLSGAVGRASADGAAVRRAKSSAGAVGGACGAAAVGFRLGAAARGRAVLAGHAPRSGAPAAVAPLGERTANRRRVTGVAKLPPPRLSVRGRSLGHAQRRPPRLAEHGSTMREVPKRVLTVLTPSRQSPHGSFSAPFPLCGPLRRM